MDRREIERRFDSEEFRVIAEFIDELPDSREKSLAMTHLEEAMFWHNAAVQRH